MAGSGLGMKRIARAQSNVSLKGMERRCKSFFLDSGAHSIYNLFSLSRSKKERFDWYVTPSGKLSKNYLEYMDDYAKFLKKYKQGMDFYATVDCIYNPEISWRALKYLEEEHGLNPVPVIHHRTPLKWVTKHIEAGYDLIGLGGLGQKSTKWGYYKWADAVFNLICDNPQRLPCIKTHGFAMTSFDILVRYPWWSSDSTSAFKLAGYGAIYVPHKRKGEFTFEVEPYIIAISHRSSFRKHKGKHLENLRPGEREIVKEWLASIDVPLGDIRDNKVIEYGVSSEYNARAVANLRFFERLCDWLPKWPWPFKINNTHNDGFFPMEEIK